MARYFFHVFNGEWQPDRFGAKHADDDAARASGRKSVGDMLAAGTLAEARIGAFELFIENESGDRIMSLRLEERHR
jgi:hypothetical protein